MLKVKIENLNKIITEELTLYTSEVKEKTDKTAKDSMKKLVKKTKDTAPVGTRKKHYKSYITSKKLDTGRYMWYVKAPEYRLSHLLENGHALRNGGRTRGTHFISKANDQIQKEFEENIRKDIESAGR